MLKETVLVHLIQLNQNFPLNLGFYNWWLPSCMFCCCRSVAKSCLQPCGLQHTRLLCSPLSNSSSVVCWSSLVSTGKRWLYATLLNSTSHIYPMGIKKAWWCYFFFLCSFFRGETFVKPYQQIVTSSFKEPVFVKSQLTVSTRSFAMQLILKVGIRRHPDLNIQKKYSAKRKYVSICNIPTYKPSFLFWFKILSLNLFRWNSNFCSYVVWWFHILS